MSRPDVEPTITHDGPKRDGKNSGWRQRHPAFGQIRASRISGESALYGSDFMHQSYIEIVVKTSTLDRGLSNYFYHGGKEVVRVALSHAQWAAFVSQADIGDGTPCTLRRIGPEDMPELPNQTPKHLQFGEEASDAMKGALLALGELRSLIAQSGLSGKKPTRCWARSPPSSAASARTSSSCSTSSQSTWRA